MRLFVALLLATAARAQGGGDFLRAAFATGQADRALLLSPDMARLDLMLANRPVAPYEHESALNYSSRPSLGKVRYDDFALSILLVTRHLSLATSLRAP